jgi:hypothetical protein
MDILLWEVKLLLDKREKSDNKDEQTEKQLSYEEVEEKDQEVRERK